MSLDGKKALVTGATSGIGRAVAERLAHEGAEVIVSGRDGTRGQQVVARITASGGSACSGPRDRPGLSARSPAPAGPAFYPAATICQIDPNVLISSPVACVVFLDARSGVK
jgi:NAD(P)-dependent dehydrogenase (short-subunit alcohol dehydrogenase family)